MPSFQIESSADQGSHARVFGLDLLRAIAIMMIVYIHAMAALGDGVDQFLYLFPATDSVSMFFVLSGYLIGRILIKTFIEKCGDARAIIQFWIFRWFRTLPNYYLILIIIIILSVVTGAELPPSTGLFFIFAQNIAWPHPSFFGEAWSLAVEEWFYLLMPLAMMGVLWRSPSVEASRRRLLLLLAAVAIASILARLPTTLSGRIVEYEDWDELLRKQVVMRFDALVIGVLGAYLSIYRRDLWTKHTRILAVVGVILIVLDRHVFTNNDYYFVHVSLTALPLATLLLMPYLSELRCRRNVVTDVIEWISRRSYSMYLVNLSLGYSVLRVMPFGWAGSYAPAAKYIAFYMVVFLLSAVLHRLWEMPMMNLRERFRLAIPAHAYGDASVERATVTMGEAVMGADVVAGTSRAEATTAEPVRPVPAAHPGHG